MNNTVLGAKLGGTELGASFHPLATQVYSDLWRRVGDGPWFGADVYDGTTYRQYRNDLPLQKKTVSATAPTNIKALGFGYAAQGLRSGDDYAAFAIYPRALSKAEIIQARQALEAMTGKTVTPVTNMAFFGTSITRGIGYVNKFFGYQYAPNASSPVQGFNGGQSGATTAGIATNINNFLSELAASPASGQKFIFVLEIGTNDLNTTAVATVTANVAALCDTIRAAGHKVVLNTILNRTEAGYDGFNAKRLAANDEYRTWVGPIETAGKHVDALCDVAATVIGTETAPDNTTYFPDKTHPSLAGYTIWEGALRPVLNGLLSA